MKKLSILSWAMATIIGITAGNPFSGEFKGTIAYASSKPTNLSVLSNEEAEKAKAEFAYEMAQITAKIVSAPNLSIESFKAEFAYATAKVTAKVMPIIPIGQQDEFAYQMAKITTKIISDPNISIEKAKANFAYEVAQLTTKIIFDADVTNINKVALLNPGRSDFKPTSVEPETKPLINVSEDSASQLNLKFSVDREALPLSGGNVYNRVSFYIASNNPDMIKKYRISIYNSEENENNRALKVLNLKEVHPYFPIRWDGILENGQSVAPEKAYEAVLEVWDKKGQHSRTVCNVGAVSLAKLENKKENNSAKMPSTVNMLEPASVEIKKNDAVPYLKKENNSAKMPSTVNMLESALVETKKNDAVPYLKIENKNDERLHKEAKNNTQGLTPEIYSGLIDEISNVGNAKNSSDNKVNVDGNIRYHHVSNSGSEQFGRDSTGLRLYLGADTEINKDWHAYAILEGQKSISNYNNFFKLSRLYAEGKVGKTTARLGSFGYLMAEGNIYDSGYKGARFDFGNPLKYSLSYGETNDTKETYVATVKYTDYDYNLESGIYHYKKDNGSNEKNTIATVGGNYNFSNFGVGAMYLNASLKDSKGDSNGYVFSFNYGELKTYRAGTYDIFAKYYNQPSGTYIAHGMNGLGGRMQGFKGHGIGMNYTLAPNFTAGIEYYKLTDKISKETSDSWWSQLAHYF